MGSTGSSDTPTAPGKRVKYKLHAVLGIQTILIRIRIQHFFFTLMMLRIQILLDEVIEDEKNRLYLSGTSLGVSAGVIFSYYLRSYV